MNDDWYTQEYLIEENLNYLRICRKYGYRYILIDHAYPTDWDSLFSKLLITLYIGLLLKKINRFCPFYS